MRVSTYSKTLLESVSQGQVEQLKRYIQSKFDEKKSNPTMNKVYLLKSPRGRPMLYYVEKLHKAQSIWYFAELTYGNFAGKPEWYLNWERVSTSGSIANGSSQVVSGDTAKKMMSDLGIGGVDKLPPGTGINAKDVEYKTI